ncbi:netrin receptor UNC5B-a-like isoform X3 [Ruditapes philippinarum]|uniref:netrin receptor UNC5B-a-like isoform X3 n=1 Tax=Ruditapes philippinarum TaxID=129788 RepID=UPI00295C212B|nr:netrin receptor UNC5B-a-like isoform X3 [Ruditapes philippinarum]
MCAQRKVCVKKEQTMRTMKEIYRIQLLTLTFFVFCAIFGVTQGVSTEITEEKEGDFGFDGRAGLLGGPEFLQEPDENYYVTKNKPATITCIASGAKVISFQCATVWIKEHQQTTFMSTDPLTLKDIVQTSITVTKDDVEDYFGSEGYWCECYASDQETENSGAITKKSKKRGHVEVAYLRKTFADPPHGARVELKGQTLLRCLPPDGKPLPEVYWLKNGQEIDVQSDFNFIIASEGNLIINQARLSDAGNYTCGARNMVKFVHSRTVPLVVFVNGGWSTWSQWTSCSASCGRGIMRRQRSCSNPTPKGSGDDCPGESVQRESCTSICPVDGLWSHWSSWSTCNTDCIHHRRRACDKPSPANGGTYCHGNDLDTQNCTNGMCRDTHGAIKLNENKDVPPATTKVADTIDTTATKDNSYSKVLSRPGGASDTEPSRQEEASEAENNENITTYIALCVAIAVFIIVIVVIIIIVRRRNNHHQNMNDREHLPNGKTLLSAYQPDLTQVTVPPPSTPLDHPNNNHMQRVNSYDKMPPTYAEIKENRLSAQMGNGLPNGVKIIEPTPNNMLTHNSSMDQLARKNDKNNMVIVNPVNTGDPRCNESENLRDSRGSLNSVELPSHIDTDAVTWSTFDHRGGRLMLPESGVTLLIPEGAICRGKTEEIYMAVCRDDKDRPKLSEKQTILSPIVLCGPTGMMLQKPVVLSVQHCASMRQGGWKLSICSSSTPLEEPPQWQVQHDYLAVTLGQETINTQIYTQIDATHCHLMTEYLQRYALIGEPVAQGRAVKILRLAAFAPSLPPSMDFSIRVYVVEDTPDALEGVMQVERRLGGRLLDKPKQIPFQDGGHNLCLTIEDLGNGWRSKLAANYQEIPFRHIWSGNQNNLHCSFSLEMVERVQDVIRCKIQVYQKAILSNRQVLKINTNFKEPPTCSSPVANTLKGRSSTVTSATNSSSGVSSVINVDTSTAASRLPSHIRNQLCVLLDTPCARGNDWRMLAQALTVDRYINYFATKTSPTEHILDLWEAIHREDTAVTDLMNILRVMGRLDAAAVLEKDIGSWL